MSYSRNKYRCLLKPHNQNVIVSHDNNIQNPNSRYPCIYPYPGIGPDYPGYPCIGPYPYAQMQQENQPPIPTPPILKPTPQPRLYPYGPYSDGPYSGGLYPYGPYSAYYPGPYSGPYGRPYPYSQKMKEKLKSKNENVENVENVGNMKPHCEYYSSSSSDSDDYRSYRRYRRRHAKVAPETDDLESNRVFDEQNQKPYPIPKPRPTPKNEDSEHKEDQITNLVTDKKSFAKPLAKLFTKFTTPEKEPEVEQIQVVEDEKKEKNLIFLKV
jgi:hypothetical protein